MNKAQGGRIVSGTCEWVRQGKVVIGKQRQPYLNTLKKKERKSKTIHSDVFLNIGAEIIKKNFTNLIDKPKVKVYHKWSLLKYSEFDLKIKKPTKLICHINKLRSKKYIWSPQ